MPIIITSEQKDTFEAVNKALSEVCKLAMKQPNSEKQFVLMTNASFKIEYVPDQKIQRKQKTYAPVAFGSKIFFPAQLKVSIYSNEF